ncbi:MAG: hypothetical protein JXB13_01910 [Phycisphaerae bacterium]|nr:hypothetical protein [Phycisphaerae bacterium]
MTEILLLSKAEVARLLGFTPRFVDKLVATGRLPRPLKIGRASRWRHVDIELFVTHLEDEQRWTRT